MIAIFSLIGIFPQLSPSKFLRALADKYWAYWLLECSRNSLSFDMFAKLSLNSFSCRSASCFTYTCFKLIFTYLIVGGWNIENITKSFKFLELLLNSIDRSHLLRVSIDLLKWVHSCIIVHHLSRLPVSYQSLILY